MRVALAIAVLVIVALVWRSQLTHVSPDPVPHPLAITGEDERAPVRIDVALPAIPVGIQRLRSGEIPLLVHYWAPWEPHSRDQIRTLDSLSKLVDPESLHVVVVCFDPFPSVARFVARQRVQTTVLLDHHRELAAVLPCPMLPFTYVVDASGRVIVAQSGPVDWLGEPTRRLLWGVANGRTPEPRRPGPSSST